MLVVPCWVSIAMSTEGAMSGLLNLLRRPTLVRNLAQPSLLLSPLLSSLLLCSFFLCYRSRTQTNSKTVFIFQVLKKAFRSQRLDHSALFFSFSIFFLITNTFCHLFRHVHYITARERFFKIYAKAANPIKSQDALQPDDECSSPSECSATWHQTTPCSCPSTC